MSPPSRDADETRAGATPYGETEVHPVDANRPSQPPTGAPPIPEEAAKAGPEARFDKFIRTRKVGSGGMGEVWRAWDTELGRWVALKFMREQEDAIEVGRFQREARLAGQLGHPNIAQVYETGVAQGRHFIAMPFLEGVTLLQFPRKDRRLLVELMRDAAQAVEFAHRAGVIHRDIKPHNIMVSTMLRPLRKNASTRVSDHHAYVMDFGLARSTRRGADASQSGDVVGTPAYMAPEQARGERVGPAGDVYGLGATLYECLTGMPPVVAPTAQETLKRILEDDVRPPSLLDRTIDRELETIVMKCLEKEPRARYRSAGELADDLTRWLAGEPILAHPPSTWYRLRKKLEQKKSSLAALAFGLALTALVIGVAWPSVRRARRGEESATRDSELLQDVAGPLYEAELLSRAGEREAATRRLEDGMKRCHEALKDGDSPLAHYFLGRFLHLSGRSEEALRELEPAIAAGVADARVERGLIRMERHGARVDELLMVAPDTWRADGSIWKNLPELDRELEALHDQAQDDFQAGTRQNECQYGLAELERATGRGGSARGRLGKVLESDPAHVKAMESMAKIELEEDHLDEAEKWATKAAERHLGDGEAYLVRARVLYRKWEESPESPRAAELVPRWQSDATKAIALGVSTAESLTYRGDGWRESGQLDLADRDYDAALALRPSWAFARRGKGLVLEGRGDLPGAILDLALVVEVLPGTRTRLLLGRARAKSGDLAGATEEFSGILRERPDDLQARLGLALVFEKLNQVDRAIGEMDVALERSPESVEAHWLRGRLRAQRSDPAGALADLQPVLRARPNDVEALNVAAAMTAAAGRADEATLLAQRSLQVKPTRDAWRVVSKIQAAAGRVPEALQAVTEALKLAPQDVDLLLSRAGLHERAGHVAEAAFDYRSASQLAAAGSAAKAEAEAGANRLKDR